jgi:hypothetical protein
MAIVPSCHSFISRYTSFLRHDEKKNLPYDMGRTDFILPLSIHKKKNGTVIFTVPLPLQP